MVFSTSCKSLILFYIIIEYYKGRLNNSVYFFVTCSFLLKASHMMDNIVYIKSANCHCN